MSNDVVSLSADALQAWSNDAEGARSNLRSIFSGLKTDESSNEWACEALDNCGVPFDSDVEFLALATQDDDPNTAYWACKLIGRLGEKANAFQDRLAGVLQSATADQATRQQAALALGLIGTLTPPTRVALENSARSSDPRLARISTQVLGSKS